MRSWIIVSCLCAIVLGTDLGGARLWDRDEPRNARCAAEMLENGDWIVPTFAGELRTHKPPLLYWMQIVSYKVFGVNEFAARLPSALCGLGTVLLTMAIATVLLGAQVTPWVGISLGTSLMFVLASRAATPDAALTFCSTLAVALYVLFSHRRISDGFVERVEFHWPTRWGWSAVYAACGLAVLAKGPIGLLLPGSVIGLHAIWQRHSGAAETVATAGDAGFLARCGRGIAFAVRLVGEAIATAWRMHPILALAAVMLVAGPWYVAVGQQTDGVWLREFFFEHNLSRALSPMEGHSGPPILFYLGTLLVGTFPWSMFAIPIGIAAREAYRTRSDLRPAIVLAMAWIAVYVGFFSIAATKLPSYITPCYPGVALCIGWFLYSVAHSQFDWPRWLKAGYLCGIVVGIAIAIGLAGPATEIIPDASIVGIAGIVLAVASCLGGALSVEKHTDLGIRSYVVGGVLATALLFTLGPRLADKHRSELNLLTQQLAERGRGEIMVAGALEPSWIFYADGPLPEVAIDLGGRWMTRVSDHLQQTDQRVALVRGDQVARLTSHLNHRFGSESMEIISRTRGFLNNDDWVAIRLGTTPARITAAENNPTKTNY
ncbi:Undecaprenyl phosphate-alpha-4-amino-4-deoxy-L-arabinose arabinosyl transferase [Rosistilla carotiformis]|uniref:Undecaprenyl phosphate-alpha-4-amino-4-deoxy-L-arabinose arabinosyl transferase n=1 Tax=Rosistilla carotiformis TaxID=2528017 RepID=A0A518JVH9_9BACT|nr:glycosyltransferase family 39 protein [Rosistilla carotiformis]QDV69552.1 Undecaprenyl phosphate-alpha-4-amino-4-deoxy-L-arabinose arabinosyl transferase [Rosistilla carotiformis]